MSDAPSEPDNQLVAVLKASEPAGNWLADPNHDPLYRDERIVNYGGGPILITRSRPDQPQLELSHNGRRCASLLHMGGNRWRLLLGEPAGNAFVAKALRWVHGDEETALAGAAPWVVLASRNAL